MEAARRANSQRLTQCSTVAVNQAMLTACQVYFPVQLLPLLHAAADVIMPLQQQSCIPPEQLSGRKHSNKPPYTHVRGFVHASSSSASGLSGSTGGQYSHLQAKQYQLNPMQAQVHPSNGLTE